MKKGWTYTDKHPQKEPAMNNALLPEFDRYLFGQGISREAYRMLGAHPEKDGSWRFAVWAPNALGVSVVGEFNNWDPVSHPLDPVEGGLWAGRIENMKAGQLYKYAITSPEGRVLYKADPYAVTSEVRPGTASRLWSIEGYDWTDSAWQKKKAREGVPYCRPMAIYEVHAGSFKRRENGDELTYRELAAELVPYVKEMGFTHVEFMPIAEHPLDASWGYQITGFYAPTSRFGTPQDFMYLVDRLHGAGIGVILDWVPAHFCKDAQGLRRFDGLAVYEHADPRQGENPQWGTCIFNYGRNEVRSFLISNAVYWLKEYHIDGLRVDAVSSMLYLNYGKEDGEWVANEFGGAENLEAIRFLKDLSIAVEETAPGTILCAEEASAYPGITESAKNGGLGFSFKWNMGWMNDMLAYMKLDPVHRKYHHDKVTFSLMYAFSENFILPFSHDEVVHGKHTLLDKMPGNYWEKFASMRALIGYQYAHPGKKLLFMGTELAPFMEWRFYEQLEWHLLQYDMHRHMQHFIQELNHFYTAHPALWKLERGWDGFKWLSADDRNRSTIAFLRTAPGETAIAVVVNFTPMIWENYRIGLPEPGTLTQVFTSDGGFYGGTDIHHNLGQMKTEEVPWNGFDHSLTLTVPPLSAVYYEYKPQKPRKAGAKTGAPKSKGKRSKEA